MPVGQPPNDRPKPKPLFEEGTSIRVLLSDIEIEVLISALGEFATIVNEPRLSIAANLQEYFQRRLNEAKKGRTGGEGKAVDSEAITRT